VIEDLETRIQRLSDLDRATLIHALIWMDTVSQAQARKGRGQRAEQAQEDSDRLWRIIQFLRSRSPADSATAADLALCDMLAEKLQAKGQWEGEV